MVQREGEKNATKDSHSCIYLKKKKDGTVEGNAKVQVLKKQIINPFFRKVSFLALILQAKFYSMPSSSNIEAI